MRTILRGMLRRCGYELTRTMPVDISMADREILTKTRPFTMTSNDRLISLIGAVRYLCQNGIEGDIAECGVWRGGSMMAVALTLMSEGDTRRRLHLYDTFAGMSAPSAADRDITGANASELLAQEKRGTGVWCEASLAVVRKNLASTGYPSDHIRFIVGKVEETIPGQSPGRLALLRLDTDWYESTRHELEHLFPLLADDGVLIIDDYGHWQGARQATDEYFASRRRKPLLHRVDYTGRMLIKSGRT